MQYPANLIPIGCPTADQQIQFTAITEFPVAGKLNFGPNRTL